MTFWERFLEKIGLRKAEPPWRAPPLVPTMPAPYIVAPLPVTPFVPPVPTAAPAMPPAGSAPPANVPPAPSAPLVVVPPPEFSTHADGSVWWRDPVRGVEMGPCATLAEAIELRNRVAARDWAQDPRNPESQQATADVPGLGFPVMPKAQVDVILANFDAAIAGGHEDKAWFQLTSQEHFALQNRGVKRVDINTMINKYNP